MLVPVQALTALNIYDWMRARPVEGGAGLRPTVFTYTAAMRAALAGGLVERALKVRLCSCSLHPLWVSCCRALLKVPWRVVGRVVVRCVAQRPALFFALLVSCMSTSTDRRWFPALGPQAA